MSSKLKPLPLSETLRDLALLRASDLDLSLLLPTTSGGTVQTASDDPERASVDSSVAQSYDFAVEARKAVRILNRGDVDSQGSKVDSIRSQLEDVLKGLESNP